MLQTPTWRANHDWAQRLDVDDTALAQVNGNAVGLAAALPDEWQPHISSPLTLSGIIGPGCDGYVIDVPLMTEAAQADHHAQADAIARCGVKMLVAVIMTGSADAIRDAGVCVDLTCTSPG